MPVRRQFIRETTVRLLADHGIVAAPVSVDDIVAALKIEVTRDDVDDELSGFLYREMETDRTVIGVNGRHPDTRQRFTIAHELGHFMLHEGEVVHVDEKDVLFTMDFRDDRSSNGNNDNEREANLFAAELLMPEHFLRSDLQGQTYDLLADDDRLKALADRYKVSLQAMTLRLTNLRHIEF